jgi:uncharacterized protein (TIGR03086 family)
VDAHQAVEAAHAGFEQRLRVVSADQWSWPTPCEEWAVRDLVNHVVVTAHMYVRLLDGCSRGEAEDILASDMLGDDPPGAFRAQALAVQRAFLEPGALGRPCAHPLFDSTGERLLTARYVDVTVHTWDLARAIAGDERLDEELVAKVWDFFEPNAPRLVASGVLGAGASGLVDEAQPLQTRLLDAMGRRP